MKAEIAQGGRQIVPGEAVCGRARDGSAVEGQGLVVAVLSHQQGRQVVVRLGQFGVGLGQRLQGGCGGLSFILAILDLTEQQTHLWIVGVQLEVLLSLFQRR